MKQPQIVYMCTPPLPSTTCMLPPPIPSTMLPPPISSTIYSAYGMPSGSLSGVLVHLILVTWSSMLIIKLLLLEFTNNYNYI